MDFTLVGAFKLLNGIGSKILAKGGFEILRKQYNNIKQNLQIKKRINGFRYPDFNRNKFVYSDNKQYIYPENDPTHFYCKTCYEVNKLEVTLNEQRENFYRCPKCLHYARTSSYREYIIENPYKNFIEYNG